MLETLQQKEPLSEFVDVAERNRKNQDHGVSRVDRLRWGDYPFVFTVTNLSYEFINYISL